MTNDGVTMALQYKVRGSERRELQKETSLLRRELVNYMIWWQAKDDMYRALGKTNPVSEEDVRNVLKGICAEIDKRQKLLDESCEVR